MISENDLNYLVETAAPEVTDKTSLKRIINENEDFQKAKKPLHFIAKQYLQYMRKYLFG
jgi:hypothetical protein